MQDIVPKYSPNSPKYYHAIISDYLAKSPKKVSAPNTQLCTLPTKKSPQRLWCGVWCAKMQTGWWNQRKKDREKDLCEWVWGGTGLKVNAHDCYSIWTPARINSILHVHLLTRILTNAFRFCFFSTSIPD